MITAENKGIMPLGEIKLNDPITEGTEVYTKVIIKRKPTLGDMDGISLSKDLDSQALALLLGRITNLSTPIIRHMTLIDTVAVMAVLKPFLPAAETGG